MSKEAKVIIFTIVILFSFYLKWCDKKYNLHDDEEINNVHSTEDDKNKTNASDFNEESNKIKTPISPKVGELDYPGRICNDQYVPDNGHSPYDSYYGNGKYDYDKENTIIVNTPTESHIVFLLKNVYSKKTIRNEFIRKNSSFSLTEIPSGTYEFSYFSGLDWDPDALLKNGEIKGGFTCRISFSKSDEYKDRMEFPDGYSTTLTLNEVVNGNLKTEEINENEFFE